MTYLLWAVLVLAVGVAAVLLFASMQSKTFSISRNIDVDAPPERIYPHIADLRAMNVWNPFVKAEPGLVCNYAGPDQGVGAEYTWAGKRAGAGRFEVVGANPDRSLDMMLHMSRPIECHNNVRFELKPAGARTNVSWTMSGPSNLISKVMGLFMSMDKMVGDQFEQGLRDLKAQAEQPAIAGR